MKVISVVDDRNRAHQLERSLIHFGWDYEIIQTSWRGFGTKLLETLNYLKNNPKVEEFVFLDGYDCFVLGTPEEAKSKLVNVSSMISGEVNCWPDADRADMIDKVRMYVEPYPIFRYPNSGSYYMKSDLFIELMNKTIVKPDMDDQRIITDWILSEPLNIDFKRDVFQTLCGATNKIDYILKYSRLFTIREYVLNKPIFIHGNGKANMEFIYNLI